MKKLLWLFFLANLGQACAQPDTAGVVKVCFLYGSKPKHAFKATEYRYFGGLHGGHVSVQVHDTDYGFGPTCYPVHLFPKKQRKSAFETVALNGQPRYSADSKTVSFYIPLSASQLAQLDSVLLRYSHEPPYDYAFFGMRCASATQDLLSAVDLIPKRRRFYNILTTFYPKRLRKRLFKLAYARNYQIERSNGKTTRVWEKD